MKDRILDVEVEAVLARFDRSSSEALLFSLAAEIARLNRSHATALARIEALETIGAVVDRMAASQDGAALTDLARAIVVGANYSLSGASGFYKLEYDVHGVPFRWTGPDPHFHFEFFVDRREGAPFSLRFLRRYGTESLDGICAFADGQEIPLELVRVHGGVEAKGLLPARSEPGGTVLMFVCPAPVCPAEAGHSTDHRRLGLAFEWLKVEARGAEQADRHAPQVESELPAMNDRTEQVVPASPAPAAGARERAAAVGK